MALTLGPHTFDGPHFNPGSILDRAGVYAILTLVGNQYYVLDIGESGTLRTRIENHDRQACWEECRGDGQLCAAVLYTPYMQQSGRGVIEQHLRTMFDPPCGFR